MLGEGEREALPLLLARADGCVEELGVSAVVALSLGLGEELVDSSALALALAAVLAVAPRGLEAVGCALGAAVREAMLAEALGEEAILRLLLAVAVLLLLAHTVTVLLLLAHTEAEGLGERAAVALGWEEGEGFEGLGLELGEGDRVAVRTGLLVGAALALTVRVGGMQDTMVAEPALPEPTAAPAPTYVTAPWVARLAFTQDAPPPPPAGLPVLP